MFKFTWRVTRHVAHSSVQQNNEVLEILNIRTLKCRLGFDKTDLCTSLPPILLPCSKEAPAKQSKAYSK